MARIYVEDLQMAQVSVTTRVCRFYFGKDPWDSQVGNRKVSRPRPTLCCPRAEGRVPRAACFTLSLLQGWHIVKKVIPRARNLEDFNCSLPPPFSLGGETVSFKFPLPPPPPLSPLRPFPAHVFVIPVGAFLVTRTRRLHFLDRSQDQLRSFVEC